MVKVKVIGRYRHLRTCDKYQNRYWFMFVFENLPINSTIRNEPRHEISNNVVCATSKASDQPAHTRRLIRTFACRLILWHLGCLPKCLSVKGGWTGSSEHTHLKLPHCWKSHVTAQISLFTAVRIINKVNKIKMTTRKRRYLTIV